MRPIGRRVVVKLPAALAALAALAAGLAIPPARAQNPPPKKPNAFFARGFDAVSILTDGGVQSDLKGRLFANSNVTFNVSGEGKSDFLNNFVKSDLVYVNCHTRGSIKAPWYTFEGTTSLDQRPLVVGNGENVFPGELSKALRDSRSAGPALVIVVGCITVTDDQVTFPKALGVKDGVKGRAYIGWRGKVIGKNADVFLMKFMEGFMTPGPGGRERTLEEAYRYAVEHGGSPYAGSFEILGDRTLRRSDLVRRPVPPPPPANTPAGVWRGTMTITGEKAGDAFEKFFVGIFGPGAKDVIVRNQVVGMSNTFAMKVVPRQGKAGEFDVDFKGDARPGWDAWQTRGKGALEAGVFVVTAKHPDGSSFTFRLLPKAQNRLNGTFTVGAWFTKDAISGTVDAARTAPPGR